MGYLKLLAYISILCGDKDRLGLPKEKSLGKVKSILSNLYQWHLIFLNWHKGVVFNNNHNAVLNSSSSKETLRLIAETQSKCDKAGLKELLKWLNKSYGEMQQIISSYSDEELFGLKRYERSKQVPLGTHLSFVTTNYYGWLYQIIQDR